MAKVRIKDLSKKFGDVVAVSNLTFEVKDGDLLILLGPSGCGKTTVLRCIAGLETPDEGEIYMGDRLVNDLSPKERDVAMVFQSYALYPTMTVYENLAFPLKARKMSKGEIDKRIRDTAALLKIPHLLNRNPGQLSGGEAQRVALGRAIIRKPQVFLMDEPLSNVDAKLRLYMRVELKRLQKDLEVTTIYVTHDQAEAMTIGDNIAIMNHGVLQQLNSPMRIYDHSANMFVAGFIGSPPMNFIDCTFVEKNGSGLLDAGFFVLPISDVIKKTIKENATSSELTLGFRPEDIFIRKERTTPESFKVNVYAIEPLGSEVIVDLKMGEHLIKTRTTPDFKLDVGENLWVALNIDKMHIFDKKTEKAII